MADKKGAIRGAIFGNLNKKFKTQVVEIFGEKVEIKQPSIGEVFNTPEGDPKKILLNMMISHCYVPGTNEKIFTSADADQILALPSGEWVKTLNEAFSDLLNIDIVGAEKNSEEVPTLLQ